MGSNGAGKEGSKEGERGESIEKIRHARKVAFSARPIQSSRRFASQPLSLSRSSSRSLSSRLKFALHLLSNTFEFEATARPSDDHWNASFFLSFFFARRQQPTPPRPIRQGSAGPDFSWWRWVRSRSVVRSRRSSFVRSFLVLWNG